MKENKSKQSFFTCQRIAQIYRALSGEQKDLKYEKISQEHQFPEGEITKFIWRKVIDNPAQKIVGVTRTLVKQKVVN